MTDANDLPEGWVLATIEQLCELNPKHSSSLKGTTEVSFVPMAAVSDTEGRIVGSETRPYAEVKKGYTHFADGDVIFAKITPCMENGKAASVRGLKNGMACGTTEFFVFRSRGAIDQDYLFNFIRQESYRKAARATMQSGVGQARVPKEFVLNTAIPLPPLAEQKRIVARLEVLQARSRNAREALAEVPALLEQYRQSVLAAAFRGDLTAAWREQNPNTEPASVLLKRIRTERRKLWEAKYPSRTYVEPEQVDDSDLPELPEGWCWASVDSLFSIITSGSRDWSRYYDRGAGTFIMAQNVRPGKLDFSETRQLVDPPFNDRDRTRSQILPGDLLITIVGANTGDICPVHDELPNHYVCQSVALMRPVDDDLQGLVLRYFLRGAPGRKIMEDLIYGQGRPHLGFDDLKRIAIPIPPLAEQSVLLNNIQQREVSIDKLLNSTDAASLDFVTFDQSLLNKAFLGELVEQDPSDEPATAMLARLKSGTSLHAPAVKQPLRIQDVVHDLILLLRTFNKPMERAALELGLVLMLNDDARTAILDKTATPGRAKASGRSYLEGLDHLLGDLAQAKRWIKITTGVPQMIALTTQAPSTDQADVLARRRVQETLQVMAAVKKERLPAVVEKVCHAAYELVSSS